ncbi:anaphase promoting complex subunit cdc16, partial [Rhizopus stolonifer]
MNPRNRASSPRTRSTPLRSDNTFDRTLRSPARPIMSSEFEEVSPTAFHTRHSRLVTENPSPFYDRIDDHDLFSTPPPIPDHISIISTDSDHLMTHIEALPKRLYNSDPTERLATREDRFRTLRQDALMNYLSGTSTFIGEKLVASTKGLEDIYNMAVSFYQQQQYERALEILNKKETLNKSVRCRYLAALCSLALEKGRDALDYLGHNNPFSEKRNMFEDDTAEGCLKLESIMCYARGKAHLLLKNITDARECFKEALTVDVKCYDALKALAKYNLMDEKSELEFVTTLPYEEHCGQDADYFRYLYGLKLKKRDTLNERRLSSDEKDISESLDVQLSTAQGFFTEGRYEECVKICESQDAFFVESIPLHVTCLFELGMKNELYLYAQELVERLNEEAVAWHAVGLYYLCCKKNEEARKYFHQALTIDQYFYEAWLGYGHSFSLEKYHDQAIEAYHTCSKLVPGSHLPLMNIAMEFMEQQKMQSALDYFNMALQICKRDPFLYNEIAVYYYKHNDFIKAHESLHKALNLAKEQHCQNNYLYEKIWCNLGHVYRHPPLRDYERALQCFQNALVRNPQNSDARGAVGMIYHLQGKIARAISEYQQALSYSDAKLLINDLLEEALIDYANSSITDDYHGTFIDDTFDISQIATTINDTSDQVEKELNWGWNSRKRK